MKNIVARFTTTLRGVLKLGGMLRSLGTLPLGYEAWTAVKTFLYELNKYPVNTPPSTIYVLKIELI